jgi:hypothetical protein
VVAVIALVAQEDPLGTVGFVTHLTCMVRVYIFFA